MCVFTAVSMQAQLEARSQHWDVFFSPSPRLLLLTFLKTRFLTGSEQEFSSLNCLPSQLIFPVQQLGYWYMSPFLALGVENSNSAPYPLSHLSRPTSYFFFFFLVSFCLMRTFKTRVVSFVLLHEFKPCLAICIFKKVLIKKIINIYPNHHLN